MRKLYKQGNGSSKGHQQWREDLLQRLEKESRGGEVMSSLGRWGCHGEEQHEHVTKERRLDIPGDIGGILHREARDP